MSDNGKGDQDSPKAIKREKSDQGMTAGWFTGNLRDSKREIIVKFGGQRASITWAEVVHRIFSGLFKLGHHGIIAIVLLFGGAPLFLAVIINEFNEPPLSPLEEVTLSRGAGGISLVSDANFHHAGTFFFDAGEIGRDGRLVINGSIINIDSTATDQKNFCWNNMVDKPFEVEVEAGSQVYIFPNDKNVSLNRPGQLDPKAEQFSQCDNAGTSCDLRQVATNTRVVIERCLRSQDNITRIYFGNTWRNKK